MLSILKKFLNFLSYSIFVTSCFILFWHGCSKLPIKSTPELQTVSFVDLDRYLGQWYEIARYPNWFEEDCFGSKAFYQRLDNGKIKVVNQCRMYTPKGELNEAIGEAKVIDTASNAKLEVQFFWPFTGDYWIIDLDENYEYAVISEPNRQYLWVLSRTPKMDKKIFLQVKQKIKEMGFDLSYLEKTP